jgi:hypothetical protein
MNCNKSFFGLFLALLVVLPGCILHVPSYRRQPLSMVGDQCKYNETQEDVTVHVKQINAVDTYYLFDDYNKAFLRRHGIAILYVSVHNLSNHDYMLSPCDINLNQVPYQHIAKLMKKTSSGGRFVVVGLSGVAFGATCAVASLPNVLTVVFGTAGAVTTGLIFLPALVQGIKSVVMNRRINKDLKEKTLHEKVIIKAGDHYEGLIFVTLRDYKPQFNVTLHEKDILEKTITFDVDVRKNE